MEIKYIVIIFLSGVSFIIRAILTEIKKTVRIKSLKSNSEIYI